MAKTPDRERRREKESETTQRTSRLEEGEEEKGEEEGWKCPSGRADIHTAALLWAFHEQVDIS